MVGSSLEYAHPAWTANRILCDEAAASQSGRHKLFANFHDRVEVVWDRAKGHGRGPPRRSSLDNQILTVETQSVLRLHEPIEAQVADRSV